MFHTEAVLKVDDGNKWILAAPLLYKSDLFDIHIQVPAGFKTDLASIPVGFRNLFNINGKHRKAAIVHDYLYRIQGDHRSVKLSRSDCDLIFKEAMACCKVNWFTRQAMWGAVRVGGWACW